MSGFDWDKSDPDEEPAVGYGRPPKHTRFKKGQSGNPSGRPKKSEQGPQTTANVEDSFRALVGQVVTFKRNGEEVQGTIFDVMANQLVAMSMQGDLKAMSFVLAYAEKFKLEAAPDDPRRNELAKEIMHYLRHGAEKDKDYGRRVMIYEKHFGELPHHVYMGHPWIPEDELVQIRARLAEGARQKLDELGWDKKDEEEEDF